MPTPKHSEPMADIISLAGRKPDPHISGEAVCLVCRHEFVSVAPVGMVMLRCPQCDVQKAVMKYPCVRDDARWECHCGNNLFHVTKSGYYCPNCGDWQHGF